VGVFDEEIESAVSQIQEKGQPATLRSFAKGVAADPSKPWEPGANVQTDETVNAVFLSYSQKYMDGSVIQAGDQQVLMPSTNTSGAAILPQIDGLVIRGGETWKIVGIKPLNPNGQSILFDLQIRQ